jgi:F-type H+-transporting ATPase subunit b
VELNWSTFLLEILNFLVLVWILKRFLYKPVLAVIARRRADIEKQLADARTLHADAEALEARYQARLGAWEQEREQARERLAGDIEAERARRLDALAAELAREREKAAAAQARREADAQLKAETTALAQAASFAARLLDQVAGPELEDRLLERVLEDLSQLPAQRVAALRNGSGGQAAATAVVTSAYPLADARRRQLEQALATLTGVNAPVQFERDPGLLAGVRIAVGAWVLSGNLRDELSSLAEFARATPSG